MAYTHTFSLTIKCMQRVFLSHLPTFPSFIEFHYQQCHNSIAWNSFPLVIRCQKHFHSLFLFPIHQFIFYVIVKCWLSWHAKFIAHIPFENKFCKTTLSHQLMQLSTLMCMWKFVYRRTLQMSLSFIHGTSLFINSWSHHILIILWGLKV